MRLFVGKQGDRFEYVHHNLHIQDDESLVYESITIPSLLCAGQSALVFDPGMDAFGRTALWRCLYSHIIKLDIGRANSNAYNPLFDIRCGEGCVEDAQVIARCFYTDAHDVDLLAVCLLYVLFGNHGHPPTFKSLWSMLDMELFEQIGQWAMCAEVDGVDFIIDTLAQCVSRKRFCQLTRARLIPLSMGYVAKNTQTSSFDMRTLAQHRASLYVDGPSIFEQIIKAQFERYHRALLVDADGPHLPDTPYVEGTCTDAHVCIEGQTYQRINYMQEPYFRARTQFYLSNQTEVQDAPAFNNGWASSPEHFLGPRHKLVEVLPDNKVPFLRLWSTELIERGLDLVSLKSWLIHA